MPRITKWSWDRVLKSLRPSATRHTSSDFVDAIDDEDYEIKFPLVKLDIIWAKPDHPKSKSMTLRSWRTEKAIGGSCRKVVARKMALRLPVKPLRLAQVNGTQVLIG